MNLSTDHKHQPRRLHLAIAIAAAATTAVAGMAVMGSGGAAQADTVSSDILASCTSPAGNQSVAIPAVVTDTPDPVVAGQPMTVSYHTDYPGNVQNSYSINVAESTWPMPSQVASIDSVTYTNLGTFTADAPIIDNVNKTVTSVFRGGGTGRPTTPTINVGVTIDAGAAGQTIDWKVFVNQKSTTSGIPLFGTINSTCTPRDGSIGQTLNSTTVVAGGTTTTTEPGSTTTSTAPETTTTTADPNQPKTCTQTSSQDGWTKTIWLVGPGGLSNSNGNSNQMYTTDDGLNRFQSSVKFAGVGGACAEGGTLPAGAQVSDATLRLTKTKNCICVGPKQRAHKITQDWSETNLRANGGPSINGTASAEFSTPGLNNAADVNSSQLTADVQSFVTNPTSNQGWSIRQRYNGSGDTGNNATPAGWATREDGTASNRPTLTITYLP